MSIKINQEVRLEREYLVEDIHTAGFLGSGNIEVLATPAMIAFMEECCLNAVQSHLPEGYTTVGVKVCISHLAAAPKGATIKVKCQLKEQNERQLDFHVEAWWNNKKIGEGEHKRFIVHKERFLQRLKEAMN